MGCKAKPILHNVCLMGSPPEVPGFAEPRDEVRFNQQPLALWPGPSLCFELGWQPMLLPSSEQPPAGSLCHSDTWTEQTLPVPRTHVSWKALVRKRVRNGARRRKAGLSLMVLIPCRLWVQPGGGHPSRHQRLPGEDPGVPPAGITAQAPGSPLSGGSPQMPPQRVALGQSYWGGVGGKGVVQPLGPGLTGYIPVGSERPHGRAPAPLQKVGGEGPSLSRSLPPGPMPGTLLTFAH